MDESSAPDKAAVESLTEAPTAAPSASKRTFTVIRANAVQSKLLLDAFEQTHITTPARLEQLEKETGLTKKWISSWFTRQRKKAQQTAAAARASTTTSTEVASSVATEQPSDASTLQVKKEVYESVILAGSAIPPAPKKKRQRKSASGPDGTSGTNNAPTTKKRKVDTAKGPSSGETSSTTSTAKSSGSIFDKLKVKAERYTPGPEERPASTVSTLATSSDAGSHIPLHALLPLLQDPRLEATGVFEHGSTYYSSATENLSISDGGQARRAASPSAVAMKSRRQRVQYAGEGPVLNTRFMHHGLLTTNAPSSPGMPTTLATATAAYQEDKFGLTPVFPYHQLLDTGVLSADGLGNGLQPVVSLGGGGGLTGQYAAQPVSSSASASLPNRIAITRINAEHTTASANGGMSITTPPESQVCRGAASYEEEEEEEERQDHYLPPVLVDEVDTFDFQPNAASCQIGGKIDSGVGFWANGMSAPVERPTGMRDLYTNASAPLGGYPQYTDFLDPLHAPLKHLTEILDPICPSAASTGTGLGRGGYEALLELEGRQRQVVMEKLLDEDLGVNDPFKAAMGLVLTSKMGLQW